MLNESIIWNNKLRTQQARLYELGRYDPPAITGVAMNDVTDGLQFMFDDEAKYEKISTIIEECEKNWHDGIYPVEPDPTRPRLIVSGGGYVATSEKTFPAPLFPLTQDGWNRLLTPSMNGTQTGM